MIRSTTPATLAILILLGLLLAPAPAPAGEAESSDGQENSETADAGSAITAHDRMTSGAQLRRTARTVATVSVTLPVFQSFHTAGSSPGFMPVSEKNICLSPSDQPKDELGYLM